MTKEEIENLRKLAKAATKGPWLNGTRVKECAAVRVEHADIYRIDPEEGNCCVACATCDQTDADYIAAANPAVMLELLDRLDKFQEKSSEIPDKDFQWPGHPAPCKCDDCQEARRRKQQMRSCPRCVYNGNYWISGWGALIQCPQCHHTFDCPK